MDFSRTYQIYKNNFRNCPCVIMANGPSLTKHDLTKIPKSLKVIGVNRSYERVWPDFHCSTDMGQLRRTPGIYHQLAKQNRLFVPEFWKLGHRVPVCTEPIFSLDLEEGAVVDIAGVGSSAYFALQVVVWLGFSRVYFLGLDLGWLDGRSHFHDGPPQTPELLEQMNGLFTLAQETLKRKTNVEVLVAGSPRSKCTAFRKVSFPWR